MKKGAKVLIIIVCIILALVLIVFVGARIYFRGPAKEYYAHSEKAFKIPDIDKNFIPQGIAFNEADNCFLVTGYMKNDNPNPIYVLDKDGNLINKVVLIDENGADFYCHAGGISIYNDYVYVAGCQDKSLYVFSYDEVKNNSIANLIGEFSTKISNDDYLNIDFTTIYDGKIVLGEFFREENFQTLPSHKINTNGGDYNQAIALVYELGDFDDTYGIDPEPKFAYSIKDLVQGMAVNDGKIYTSSSYAVAQSSICEYDLGLLSSSQTIDILGFSQIPLYELDSSVLTKEYVFPPMAEEIEFVDGKMYTMCESASNKYFFGKLTSHNYCYSTNLY